MYCIYQITNKINGNRYIGQHKYVDESNPMKGYKGSGLLLWEAYKKYGMDNFETEVLYSRIRDKSTVDAMEIWAIAKYKPEYNIFKGGTGGVVWKGESPMKGRHHSVEARRKMSEDNHHESNHHWYEHADIAWRYWTEYNEHLAYVNSNRYCKKPRRHLERYWESYVELFMSIYKQHSLPSIRRNAGLKLKGRVSPTKGKKWYNNGQRNIMAIEPPSDEWVPGYIPSERQRSIWESDKFKKTVSKARRGVRKLN